MWILYHYLPKTQPLFSQNRNRKLAHVILRLTMRIEWLCTIKNNKKSVPKARTHQADNLAKLRHEFLSLPELSQILCAVAVKKSSVALGVAYTYATPLPRR